MPAYLIFGCFYIAVCVAIVLVNAITYSKSRKAVIARRKAGDWTCCQEQTWYGWRVKEYAEEME